MKLNVFAKLFLALFVSLVLILALIMGSVQWSFRSGFTEYLERVREQQLTNLATTLAKAYQEHDDSWSFLEENPEFWIELIGEDVSRHHGSRRPHHPRPGGPHDNRDQHEHHPPPHPPPPFPFPPPPPPEEHLMGGRVRLLDVDQHPIAGPPHPTRFDGETLTPIHSNNRLIGWLGSTRGHALEDELDKTFISQQVQSNLMILGLAFIVSILASFLLARQLLKPIKKITHGARHLAAGRFDIQIESGSRDELGELAQHFNFLARTLKQNETSRRQWLADISHELRTPLSILRGEIEALLDGIRAPTSERLASLHAETLRLSTLVDDLHQLSLHDMGALTYRMEALNPVAILDAVIRDLEPRYAERNVQLRHSEFPKPCTLMADPGRLRQLFLNILENSCRYTDPGGFCHIQCGYTDTEVWFDFEDTTPGVPDGTHERLFERLFRLDRSRNRELGGSGLGLAICKSIVEALGGDIHAMPSRFGGLWIRVTLKRNTA